MDSRAPLRHDVRATTAIATSLARTYAVRVVDGRAEPVTVSRGQTMGDLVEILATLNRATS